MQLRRSATHDAFAGAASWKWAPGQHFSSPKPSNFKAQNLKSLSSLGVFVFVLRLWNKVPAKAFLASSLLPLGLSRGLESMPGPSLNSPLSIEGLKLTRAVARGMYTLSLVHPTMRSYELTVALLIAPPTLHLVVAHPCESPQTRGQHGSQARRAQRRGPDGGRGWSLLYGLHQTLFWYDKT